MKKTILLVGTCILALITPIYNIAEPRLFGFPFFYWYLLLIIPVSSLLIYLAYRSEKR
jgi:cellobiose-specific phosphotransferase system component IIC